MEIRRWQKSDVEKIAQMERECFSDPWSKEAFLECFDYPYYHGFVAEEGGRICGYCCLISLFEVGEIANIAVEKSRRGQGVGTRLMQTMEERAKSLGAERCLLEVRRSNAPALALYARLGYEPYGVRAKYYPDGEDAVLMEKRI